MFLLLPRRPEIGASQLPRPHLAFSRQTLQLPLALKPRGSSRMDNFFSCGVALAGLRVLWAGSGKKWGTLLRWWGDSPLFVAARNVPHFFGVVRCFGHDRLLFGDGGVIRYCLLQPAMSSIFWGRFSVRDLGRSLSRDSLLALGNSCAPLRHYG